MEEKKLKVNIMDIIKNMDKKKRSKERKKIYKIMNGRRGAKDKNRKG